MTPMTLQLMWLLLLRGRLMAETSSNLMLLAYQDELNKLRNLNFNPRSSVRNLPSSLDDVSESVFFYLCTRRSQNKQLFPNSLKSLLSSSFDRTLPTKFVVHGFLSNSDKLMSQSIKDNLLKNEDVNVILVDWGAISVGLDYSWIANKTQEVGIYTAQMINLLIDQGAMAHDIHLIGHSLGAHVCGFAGDAVKNGKIGRITGLDPAKPGFHDVPPGQRLDPSDAMFVDCIHTCGGILGIAEPICTADFYPNGGVNAQPGCNYYDFGRCSHLRAHKYFAESVDPEFRYPALECHAVPDDSEYPSRCSPCGVTMGYHTNRQVRGIYFVITNSEPPYATIHP